MAFDFSKLKALTPEERKARNEAERQQQIERDRIAREAKCKHTLVLTLTRMPEPRFSVTDHFIHFQATDNHGRRVTAVHMVPYFRERDEVHALVETMDTGSTLTVRGCWHKRTWKTQDGQPRQSWEFQIQFIDR